MDKTEENKPKIIFENKNIRISVTGTYRDGFFYKVEESRRDALWVKNWNLLLTAYYEVTGHCRRKVTKFRNFGLEEYNTLEYIVCDILHAMDSDRGYK